MKSSRNSQSNFNIFNSLVCTYRQQQSCSSQSPRLSTLQSSLSQLQKLCSELEYQKHECNRIRNSTHKIIEMYQLYHNQVEGYIEENKIKGLGEEEYGEGNGDQGRHYCEVALKKAGEYLKLKQKQKQGDKKAVGTKGAQFKNKSIDRVGEKSSKILKRLNQSLVKSPQLFRK